MHCPETTDTDSYLLTIYNPNIKPQNGFFFRAHKSKIGGTRVIQYESELDDHGFQTIEGEIFCPV